MEIAPQGNPASDLQGLVLGMMQLLNSSPPKFSVVMAGAPSANGIGISMAVSGGNTVHERIEFVDAAAKQLAALAEKLRSESGGIIVPRFVPPPNGKH